jgi:hypothetical protein
MEIEVWSAGKVKFAADPEFQEPVIREVIDQRGDVASVIVDYTDSERSDISHDEYARVTGDLPGLVLFEGWLTGDRDAPAPVASRDDAGTIKHVPTGATWVTWDHRKQPPWELVAEAVARLTHGAVKIRAAGDEDEPDRLAVAVYRDLPEVEDA